MADPTRRVSLSDNIWGENGCNLALVVPTLRYGINENLLDPRISICHDFYTHFDSDIEGYHNNCIIIIILIIK